MRNQSLADAGFDALGDPMRRRIVEQLCGGPMPVGALAAGLPVGRPAVSKHLRVLEGAGLVEHRSAGTRNLYALAPHGLTALQQWLVEVWDTRLAAFAAHVTTAHGTPADGTATRGTAGRGAAGPSTQEAPGA